MLDNEYSESVLESISSAVVVLDSATREVLYANKATKEIILENFDTYKGKTCYEYLRSLHAVCDDCIIDCMKNGESNKKTRYVKEKDKFYVFDVTKTKWKDRNVVILNIIDVTEQERERIDIDKKQRQFYYKRVQNLFKTVTGPLGCFVVNLTNNYVTEQVVYENYIEKQKEEIRYTDYLDLIKKNFLSDDEYEEYYLKFSKESLLELYSNGITTVDFTHRYMFTDEKMRYIVTTANILLNPITREVEAIISAVDVTDKIIYKKIAQQLVNEKYDIVALIIPSENRVEFCYANNEYAGIPQLRIYDYEENRQNAARQLFVGDQAEKYLSCTALAKIEEQLKANGYYEFSNFRIIDNKKRIKNYYYVYLDREYGTILCTVEDVTEQHTHEEEQLKIVEDALAESKNANLAKSEFLSRMSHDIRTPMNAIINMTKFAIEDCREGYNDKVIDSLNKVESTSDYLLSLINDILDVSRIESGKMELEPSVYYYEEFCNYIDCMIRPLCAKKNIRFIWEQMDEYAPLYMDKLRFNQMVLNLLSNAVKYTPEGGTVEFVERDVIRNKDYITCSFSVIDNGIGMTEDFQKKMFEIFEREKNEKVNEIQGSGLGLPIVKKIVDLMGGELAVKSKPGEGSTFTFRVSIPFATKEQIEKEKKNKELVNLYEESLEGKSILIVDDQVLNMEIIKRLLEIKGMKVITAVNGQEAVDCFKNSPEGCLDAIMMDMRMPVMDGIQATSIIRRMRRKDAVSIPIIAMTANAFEEDKRKAEYAGMTGYITKPIDAKNMYRVLKQQICGR